MFTITEVHNGFDVKFKYEPWIVEAIKKIPGAQYKGAHKKWFIPEQSKNTLLNWAKPFATSVKIHEAIEIGEIEPLPELDIEVPLLREMFPYQAKGVAYSLKHKRVIVGDQPGLGKTGQAIATSVAAQAKCILVVCPATIKDNWKREFKIWTGREAMVLSDRVKNTWPQFLKVGMCNVFIVNYESLKKYFVHAINVPNDPKTGKPEPMKLKHIVFKETINLFDFVIIDEIHRCKDGGTQTSKFCMGIARDKEFVLGLTGTPVVNKPVDLVPQLHIINRLSEFGNYSGFINRYCSGPTKASNLKELNFLMHKTCFYRREKKEVLKDLPDKMRNIIRVEIDNEKEYKFAEENFKKFLERSGASDGQITRALRAEVLVQMMLLKKLAAKGKVNAVLEHIREVTEAGEKIVVFAWHKEIIEQLHEAIPGSVTIVGDNTMLQRQNAVDNFQMCAKCKVKHETHGRPEFPQSHDHDYQNNDTQVILLNIKSGGVGITLTASSRVLFIEQPWHPADYDQCEDRTHRIGQKNAVESSNVLGHNTIDEYIYKIIENKRAIADQVTGAEDEIITNVVDEFINLFNQKK